MRIASKILLAISLSLLVPAFIGCGGGGGGPVGTRLKLQILWGPRSRALDAPSSALSAVVSLPGASAQGGDFSWVIDRDPNRPEAYTGTYESAEEVLEGAWDFTATFRADPGGGGAVVGVAQDEVTVNPDGTGVGTITTANAVASVAVAQGQGVKLGTPQELVFSAFDQQDNLVAVTPGSALWEVVSGGDKLEFTADGLANGLTAGTAGVTATVDKVTSDPIDVQVFRWREPIFIINGLAETLSVYDRGDNSIQRNATAIGHWPNFMAVNAGLGYVVNSGDNNVQILNLDGLSLETTLDLGAGNNPMQIALVGGKGYVSNLVSNTVSVIDLAARPVITTIPVGSGPTPIAAAGGKVFVGNTNFNWETHTYGRGTLSVIDPASDEVTNTISVGTNPQAMAVDAQGRLHVVCTGDYASITGEVWVIDPATDQVVGDPVAIGGSPGSISIAPSGTAYLISTSFSDPSARGLLAYNSETLEVTIPFANIVHIGTNPFGLLADDTYVYVSDFDEDSLYRYDPSSGETVNLGVVGDGPQFLAGNGSGQ